MQVQGSLMELQHHRKDECLLCLWSSFCFDNKKVFAFIPVWGPWAYQIISMNLIFFNPLNEIGSIFFLVLPSWRFWNKFCLGRLYCVRNPLTSKAWQQGSWPAEGFYVTLISINEVGVGL